jgi:hypothetical protein
MLTAKLSIAATSAVVSVWGMAALISSIFG